VVDLGNMTVKYLLASKPEEHLIPSIFVHFFGHLWGGNQGNRKIEFDVLFSHIGNLFRMGWELFMERNFDYTQSKSAADCKEEIRERYESLSENNFSRFKREFQSSYFANIKSASKLPAVDLSSVNGMSCLPHRKSFVSHHRPAVFSVRIGEAIF
jgi:hypothetical protein